VFSIGYVSINNKILQRAVGVDNPKQRQGEMGCRKSKMKCVRRGKEPIKRVSAEEATEMVAKQKYYYVSKMDWKKQKQEKELNQPKKCESTEEEQNGI